jgi:hypothetical protein
MQETRPDPLTPKKDRPIGFIILALLLGWLSISSFVGVFLGVSNLNPILALLYGVTAIITATGLWKMKSWTFTAYLSWCAAVILMMIVMQMGYIYRLPLPMFIAFACVLITIISLIGIYIKKRINYVMVQNKKIKNV